MFKPQRPQNLEFSGRGEEHRGQGNVFPVSPGLISTNERPPQRPQNFTPSAKRELHPVHATIPGMRLEGAPLLLLLPCEGDGWLPGPRIVLNCAWMTCSPDPSLISMTRSSSCSPAFETLST
jgi:hypothetical protein